MISFSFLDELSHYTSSCLYSFSHKSRSLFPQIPYPARALYWRDPGGGRRRRLPLSTTREVWGRGRQQLRRHRVWQHRRGPTERLRGAQELPGESQSQPQRWRGRGRVPQRLGHQQATRRDHWQPIWHPWVRIHRCRHCRRSPQPKPKGQQSAQEESSQPQQHHPQAGESGEPRRASRMGVLRRRHVVVVLFSLCPSLS